MGYKNLYIFFGEKNVAFLLLFLVLRHQVQSPDTISTIFNLYRDMIECQPVGYNKKKIGQSDTIQDLQTTGDNKNLTGAKSKIYSYSGSQVKFTAMTYIHFRVSGENVPNFQGMFSPGENVPYQNHIILLNSF